MNPADHIRAWKQPGLTPEERIDAFCDLIDHAVANGVELRDLYNRKHLKELVLFIAQQGLSK